MDVGIGWLLRILLVPIDHCCVASCDCVCSAGCCWHRWMMIGKRGHSYPICIIPDDCRDEEATWMWSLQCIWRR